MKICVKCKNEYPATAVYFFFRNKSRGWLSSWCKACKAEHRSANMARELVLQNARRKPGPCPTCGLSKEAGKKYRMPCLRKSTAAKKKADKCIYKSRLRKQTPRWADKGKIKEFYKSRPAGMHVDHVIPLRGNIVSGLHVHTNLQYLPQIKNMLKSNRFNDGNHYSLEHEGVR